MTDDRDLVQNVSDLATLAARINEEHRQAEAHAVSAVEHAAKAGRLLVAAKAGCAHGTWLPWLEANVACSVRTAQAYMRVARHWDELVAKSADPAHLSIDGALRMLAEPDAPSISPGDVGAATAEIKTSARSLLANLVAMGQAFAKVDGELDRGQFGSWALRESRYTPDEVAELIRLAAQVGGETGVAHLSDREVGAIIDRSWSVVDAVIRWERPNADA